MRVLLLRWCERIIHAEFPARVALFGPHSWKGTIITAPANTRHSCDFPIYSKGITYNHERPLSTSALAGVLHGSFPRKSVASSFFTLRGLASASITLAGGNSSGEFNCPATFSGQEGGSEGDFGDGLLQRLVRGDRIRRMKPVGQFLMFPSFLAFAFWVPPVACVAQSAQKFSVTVQLTVTTENEALKNQVASFLNRDLRSLGDVTLVDEKPFFLIDVIVMKVQIKGELRSGSQLPHRSRGR
jgi:hypothetical protein